MTDTPDPRATRPVNVPVSVPVNVTALFAEAASKSGVLWVQAAGESASAVWHAWAEDTVYVVSGPGEQDLPWLPPEVLVTARSKDNGGRLLTVRAIVEEVTPRHPGWETATGALKAGRLNSTDDVVARWAEHCTVRALRPFGAPLEAPGTYPTTSGAAAVHPAEGTTATWRPWHLRGRPLRRRGNRFPDEG